MSHSHQSPVLVECLPFSGLLQSVTWGPNSFICDLLPLRMLWIGEGEQEYRVEFLKGWDYAGLISSAYIPSTEHSFTALHLMHTRLGKVIFLCIFLCTQETGVTWKACGIVSTTVPETGSCSSNIKEASEAGELRMREIPGTRLEGLGLD